MDKKIVKDYLLTLNEIFTKEKANVLKYRKQRGLQSLKARERYRVAEYPPLVQLGISNVCNLKCPQCYYPLFMKKPGFSPIFMRMNLLKKIVDEVAEFPSNTMLRFLGRGESLIHPHIREILQYTKLKIKGPVALITNGHLLDEKNAYIILKTGIDVIDISLDALTARTYAKVRGENFDLTVENVKNLVILRNKGKYRTKIMVSFLIQPENYFEAKEFRKVWTPIVDKVIFRKYHTYGGKIKEKPHMLEKRYPCAALWNRVNINESGKITLCYVDWDESSVLADLRKSGATILKTWRTAYEEARKGHLSGKYPDLCSKCKTGWQAAHWKLSYEQAVSMLIDR